MITHFLYEDQALITAARKSDLREALPSLLYATCVGMYLQPVLSSNTDDETKRSINEVTQILTDFHTETWHNVETHAVRQWRDCAWIVGEYWGRAKKIWEERGPLNILDDDDSGRWNGEYARELWIMRVLVVMRQCRVVGVCEDCLRHHWAYVDERMDTLEDRLMGYFGLKRETRLAADAPLRTIKEEDEADEEMQY